MAAGFNLKKDKLKNFENFILNDFLSKNTLRDNIFLYDAEVSSSAFNRDFYNEINNHDAQQSILKYF